jgi:hypothetical protein
MKEVMEKIFIPKFQETYYINFVGKVFAGYSLREAARIMNIALKSLQSRVKNKTIDYFLVNGRVFIYDWTAISYRKGKVKENRITEVTAYEVRLEGLPFFMIVYGLPILGFILDTWKKCSVEKILMEVEVVKGVRLPTEILISEKEYAYARYHKKEHNDEGTNKKRLEEKYVVESCSKPFGYFVLAENLPIDARRYYGDKKNVKIKEMSIEEFKQFKKNFLS